MINNKTVAPDPETAPGALPTLPDGQEAGRRRVAIPVTPQTLVSAATDLAAEGYRVALVAAHDDGTALRAVYLHTAPGDRRVELCLPLDRDEPVVPSLAGLSFAAGRFERQMHDLYGVQLADHPDPRRLVRHVHWPSRWFPMRADAGTPPGFGETDGPFPFLTVEGPGVYEIPVGPVHAGLIEPGHFRFSAVGEHILKLKIRLWYLHRGVEKLFEGRDLPGGVLLAERISGDTSVGHALAYCRAVEDALNLDLPVETERMRSLLLELERLYNHAGDLGALCNDVGYGILNSHALRIRERLLRLNEEVTGHRLLRGALAVGGATLRAVPAPGVLEDLVGQVRDLSDLALANSVLVDRFDTTAVLTAEQARDLGTLGYVARASGLDADARCDHPAAPAEQLVPGFGPLRFPTQSTGDVMARFQQRVAEFEASVSLVTALSALVSPGAMRGWPTVSHRPPSLRHGSSGVGIAEGWRGTIVHRVELNSDYRITRHAVVDPSFFNWPALPVALAGAIVPDFPLVNKSFNLSYAGNDL